jgi:hypothetical protein
MRRTLVSLTVAAAVAMPAFAQDASNEKYLELLRSDLRTARTELVTEALELNDAQGAAFWPVYREYEKELSALGDRRIANIKQYAANYDSMTDKVAKDLVANAFKLNEQRTGLLKKYHGKVGKVLPPTLAARWIQVESALNALVDLQVASELPLMK